jgi:hypothetical protein
MQCGVSSLLLTIVAWVCYGVVGDVIPMEMLVFHMNMLSYYVKWK